MTAVALPIHRLDTEARFRAVARYTGKRVTVTLDIHRDGSLLREVTGQLLAVASPCGPGPQSHTVVVEAGLGRVLAIAITRVRAIEVAR